MTWSIKHKTRTSWWGRKKSWTKNKKDRELFTKLSAARFELAVLRTAGENCVIVRCKNTNANKKPLAYLTIQNASDTSKLWSFSKNDWIDLKPEDAHDKIPLSEYRFAYETAGRISSQRKELCKLVVVSQKKGSKIVSSFDEDFETDIADFGYHRVGPSPGTVYCFRSFMQRPYLVVQGPSNHEVWWESHLTEGINAYGSTNDWWDEVARGNIIVVYDPMEESA